MPTQSKLDELVAEVATKGMVGMSLAMHDGSRKHHQKVLDEAKQLIKDLMLELIGDFETHPDRIGNPNRGGNCKYYDWMNEADCDCGIEIRNEQRYELRAKVKGL